MSKNIWAKTILSTYRYLQRIAGAIDKMIEDRGLYSRDMSGASFSTNNILSLSEKLIELSERKIKLINLKLLTEKSLEFCGESSASLLIAKYIDGKKNMDIIEEKGLSYRTFFRRLDDAESKFEIALAHNGFTKEKIETYLSSELWIMEVKNRISALRVNQDLDVSERQLDRLAVI